MILFTVNEERTALVPASGAAVKILAELVPGENTPVEFLETASHRDLRRHVFGVLSRVAKALNTETDKFRIIMLMRTGRCHLVQVPITDTTTGKKHDRYVAVVDSMARQFMDEDELRTFYQDMRRNIIDAVLPQIAEPARSDIAGLIDAAA